MGQVGRIWYSNDVAVQSKPEYSRRHDRVHITLAMPGMVFIDNPRLSYRLTNAREDRSVGKLQAKSVTVLP
jgi:hypothetical protein